MTLRAVARSRRNAAHHAALALVVAAIAAASVDGSTSPDGSFGRADAAVPRNVGGFDAKALDTSERLPGPTLALTPLTVMTKPARLAPPRQDAAPVRPQLPSQPRAKSVAPLAPVGAEEPALGMEGATTPDQASLRIEDVSRQAGAWAAASLTEITLSVEPGEPAAAAIEPAKPEAKTTAAYGRGWLIAPRAAITYHSERADRASQTLFQARLGRERGAVADIDDALAGQPVSEQDAASPRSDSYSLTISAGLDIAWGLVRIDFTGLVDGAGDAPEDQSAVAMVQLALG